MRVSIAFNESMDKSEQRRLALAALVEAKGRGAIAEISGKTGILPNYVSRMLYPPGKDGRKGIGEDIWDLLVTAYPQLRDAVGVTGVSLLTQAEAQELLQRVAEVQSVLAVVLAETIRPVGKAFVEKLAKLDPTVRNHPYVRTLIAGLRHEIPSLDSQVPPLPSRRPRGSTPRKQK